MIKKPDTKQLDTKKPLDSLAVNKILRVLSPSESFYFYTAIGNNTGKSANSLSDFANKLETLDVQSVDFHFPRQDFEKWIRNTIADNELAQRIASIKRDMHGESLRGELIQIVKTRVNELKATQSKPKKQQ